MLARGKFEEGQLKEQPAPGETNMNSLVSELFSKGHIIAVLECSTPSTTADATAVDTAVETAVSTAVATAVETVAAMAVVTAWNKIRQGYSSGSSLG